MQSSPPARNGHDRTQEPEDGTAASQAPRGRPGVDNGCPPLGVIAHDRQLRHLARKSSHGGHFGLQGT
jgi:hypothetical protein